MTRLESGAMEPQIRAGRSRRCRRQRARARRERCWPRIASTVDLAADLPMLRLDPVLFEQVLFNLLDNAAKYTRPAAPNPARGAGATATVRLAGARRGRGHSARRSRAHLRQVLPRPGRRPEARGHRARPRHLPRLRRGHGRHDRRRQPRRPRGRGVHHHAAGRRPTSGAATDAAA